MDCIQESISLEISAFHSPQMGIVLFFFLDFYCPLENFCGHHHGTTPLLQPLLFLIIRAL